MKTEKQIKALEAQLAKHEAEFDKRKTEIERLTKLNEIELEQIRLLQTKINAYQQ